MLKYVKYMDCNTEFNHYYPLFIILLYGLIGIIVQYCGFICCLYIMV
jgi:hypothetical protein